MSAPDAAGAASAAAPPAGVPDRLPADADGAHPRQFMPIAEALTKFRRQLRAFLAKNETDVAQHLLVTQRFLAKQRGEMLRPLLIREIGLDVWSGPFAGMRFLPAVAEGCYMPKLIGCYEAELHPWLLELKRRRRYTRIVDIGAAEGYYAVGLARMWPEARVLACDANPHGMPMLRNLIQLNKLEGRIEPGGIFGHADFDALRDVPSLVFADIEGAEKDLLDPAKAPVLRRCDVIVEVHEVFDPTLPDLMRSRFAATHDVTIVRETGRDVPLPAWFDGRDSVDRWLAVWEHRAGPTPWAVMLARDFPA